MKPSTHFTEAMNKGGQALNAFIRGLVCSIGVLGSKITKGAEVVDAHLAKG